jgi:Gram-negative bacterial TonB protein C-terminal
MSKQMTLTVVLGILVFASIGRTADCNVGVRRLVMPDYPNVARLAQISGDVHLVARVGADGRVTEVAVVSGAPILARYARANLLSWAYTCQPKGGNVQVLYRYRLQGEKVYGAVAPEVSLESPGEILITSNPPLPEANHR